MRLADLAPVKLLLPALALIAVALAPAPEPIDRLPQPVFEEITIEVLPPPPAPAHPYGDYVTACP
jgi:hypothetical protein